MTQTKRKPLLSGRWTRWGFPLLFFLAVFLLYLTLMLDPYFTDEQDVFYGGYNVVMSGDIYGSYVSQHMPFSYYMAAVPALLGARTVYQFRLGFYVMMSHVNYSSGANCFMVPHYPTNQMVLRFGVSWNFFN